MFTGCATRVDALSCFGIAFSDGLLPNLHHVFGPHASPKGLRHGFGVSAGIPIDLIELLVPDLIVGAPGLLRGGGLDKTFLQPLDPCVARDRIASRCDRGSGRLTPPFC